MLFGKFRILGKLALLMCVPLLGVIALAVPIVVNRVDAARDARDTADIVDLANQVGGALQEVHEERLLSVGYVLGLVDRTDVVLQSAIVKDDLAQVTARGDALSPALEQALGWAASLERTRKVVLAKQTRPQQVIEDFSLVVTPIVNALDLSTAADLTTDTGRQILALDQALRTDDLMSQAASYLTAAAATKEAGMVSLFSAKLIELRLVIERGEPFFTDAQYRLYLLAQSAFMTRVGTDFFSRTEIAPAAAISALDAEAIFPSLSSVIVLGGFLDKRIASDVDAAVTQSRREATNQAYLVGGISVLLLIAVFALSLVMARAVARPLRRLTGSADRIARAAEAELQRVADDDMESTSPLRLAPVDVQAKDEIGDLARAFDRVQSTAVRLVERQVAGRRNVAQMFGHVGRRTQNLVGRQLALIDSLERRETDSGRLRELYRLDHMSSRLRRNASSLVVLSGGASANDHMAPLALSDVVRLALGEIEDYTRVDVRVPEELTVLPAVVADLTLLLAELMENATAFSPPHTRVTVTAEDLRGGARLQVIDHGLGLSPDRIAEENARLTTRERLDLAPSEVLGLFVVGRLARRHGLEVSLAATPDGGLTAVVDLKPSHLLARPTIAVDEAGSSAAVGVAQPAADAGVPAPLPFDTGVLKRATRTLSSGRSWNAFAPVKAPAAEPEPNATQSTPAAPAAPAAAPAAAAPMTQAPAAAASVTEAPAAAPVAAAGSTDAVEVPRQRSGSGQSTLRRRIPGRHLPAETGPKPSLNAPTHDDAAAARNLVEAFEAGVSRAKWDAIEADLATTPAAEHPPLVRRVPGATLPLAPAVPAPKAAPSKRLDPQEARDLIEQFEYGVALAMNEVRPQHEGQPR